MSLSSGDWLYSELERASEEFRRMPEWSRPVVTAPRQGQAERPKIRTGFQPAETDESK